MIRHNTAAIKQLSDALADFEKNECPLPGISNAQDRTVFIKQVIDSKRRVGYVAAVERRPINPDRANPANDLFDPVKAILIHKRNGNFDEACWLVFLFTHFGRHSRLEWRLLKDVYGKLGQQPHWTWTEISRDPEKFRDWLRNNQRRLKASGAGFGNHRKYVSLDADKPNGTGSAFKSYVDWVVACGGHKPLIDDVLKKCGGKDKEAFHELYEAMDKVVSFGRMGKFDYLTMLAKAGLAPIEPGCTYVKTSTGPIKGARLILEGSIDSRRFSLQELEDKLTILADCLGVGMQVIEDSLCNWQKSPSKYKLFSG